MRTYRLQKRDAEDLAGFLAAVTAVALMTLGILFSIWQWNDDVRAAKHRKDWTVHSGTVVAVSSPDFSSDPPTLPSRVAFRDYYGQPQRVTLDLAYGRHVGDTLPVDVGSNGDIYAPTSADYVNQVLDDPFTAHHVFWPISGIILVGIVGGILGGLVSWLPWYGLLQLPVPWPTRRRELWTSEELQRREKEAGL